MADKEVVGYCRYYTGSCLVKFEKDYDDFYVTEILTKDGKAVIRVTKNGTDIIEEHSLGIVDIKPLDLKLGDFRIGRDE